MSVAEVVGWALAGGTAGGVVAVGVFLAVAARGGSTPVQVSVPVPRDPTLSLDLPHRSAGPVREPSFPQASRRVPHQVTPHQVTPNEWFTETTPVPPLYVSIPRTARGDGEVGSCVNGALVVRGPACTVCCDRGFTAGCPGCGLAVR